MAYHIEVLVSNPELVEVVETAISSLNKVQDEFCFNLPNEKIREKLYYSRTSYTATDLFAKISSFKEAVKGDMRYLIYVVDQPLSSERYSNLFGTIDTARTTALFTVNDFDQFLNDKKRFCTYYLTRYALNFLAPPIQSHNRETDKNCIFHFKKKKAEILLSLNSGHICDSCKDIMHPYLTREIEEEVNKLLLVVSNQYPYSIVLKGGGVKGLAFAGALLELEKYFSFNAFAGTSAGAIGAILLGAGYNPTELMNELQQKNFKDFKDAGLLQGLVNFINKGGFHPGATIETWINECLKKKIVKQGEIELQNLPMHTTVYASRIKNGTLLFDSRGERHTAHASYAARCSMSIPYYFTAPKEDGIKVYDGGLRNNFPMKRFMDDNKKNPVIGIYLKSSTRKNWLVINELLNMTVDGEEMKFVDENKDKVVIVDTHPIKTTDFNLTKNKKDFLILSGRIGALKFMVDNFPDIAIDDTLIQTLEKEHFDLKHKL